MSERERLIAWLNERQMDYKTLARALKWSPAQVYGFLGGAWNLPDSFRWAFGQEFGFDVAVAIFGNGRPVQGRPEGVVA